MMDFNNVTKPCLLLPPDPTMSILSFIPPPQLHLMMGCVNHPFNLMRSLMAHHQKLPEFDKWCRKHSITRRGYEANSLDGNNSSLFMKAVEKLREAKMEVPEGTEDEGEPLVPPSGGPILDTLSSLLKVVQGTMSHQLDPSYKEYIASYKTHLLSLPGHMMAACGMKTQLTWKEHVVICHLEQWLDANKRGLAPYSEQASESIHKMHEKLSWGNYKVPVGHKNYAKRIKLSVVKTSSLNFGLVE